jgi:hypothetical protein
LGIRYDLIVDPRRENLETINAAKIAKIKEMIGPSLESFEGPNEYNLTGIPTWAQDLTNYQKNLYPAVKSNPSTSNIPVIAPALGRPYPSERPDLRAYADYGNMHSYSGGKIPSDWGLDNYIMPVSRAMTGTKPIMATETGYHTASNWAGGHPSVSEKAMGKYMPRLMFEYFNRDVRLTHAYELIDQKSDPNGLDRSDNFGLLRSDGTEKPAYKALENLIDLLQDPGPRFQPKSLDYTLSGATKDVHSTLLQKRDGRFYLVLWREMSSYNLTTKQDISVPSQKVTLTLNQPVSKANTYLPNGSLTPTKQYASPKSLTLAVPDEPLVIELTPSTTSPRLTSGNSE